MKFQRIALAVSMATLAVSSFAGTVSTSSNISLLAIDGQKPESALLKNQTSFEANPAQTHQVVVRVSEIIREGSDSSLFESQPIIVTFTGQSDDLMISSKSIRDSRQANNFNKNPHVILQTKSGQEVSSTQDVLKQEGLFPATRIIEDLSSYNASQQKASVPSFASATFTAVMPSATKAAKSTVTVQGDNVAEQMLQYWYQQADKETQTRFLQWASKQK